MEAPHPRGHVFIVSEGEDVMSRKRSDLGAVGQGERRVMGERTHQ